MFALIKNRKIRLAIVGYGRVASYHFDAVRKLADDIELVAICDTDCSVLRKIQHSHAVKTYENFRIMLENEEIDVVSLCTPSGLHAQQTILAAKYGVSVLCEKPIATSWRDGLSMVDACKDAGVKLWVVKQNRNNPTIRLLERAIREQRFGDIKMVQVNVFWNRPQSYYDQAAWRGTTTLDGGALMNQASHYVDLLTWLVGPIDCVHAITSTTRDIEVEDTGVLNIKWRNGALGSMSVTMLAHRQNIEGSITVLGENGTARIGGTSLNEVQLWDFQDKSNEDALVNLSSYKAETVYGKGHFGVYQNVIDVCCDDAGQSADGFDGLKTLEVLVAAYQSASGGGLVHLPLKA